MLRQNAHSPRGRPSDQEPKWMDGLVLLELSKRLVNYIGHYVPFGFWNYSCQYGLLELWTVAALFNKKEAVCRICEIWVDLLILRTDNANGSQTARISSVKSLFSLMWFKRISSIHYYGIRWLISWEEIIYFFFILASNVCFDYSVEISFSIFFCKWAIEHQHIYKSLHAKSNTHSHVTLHQKKNKSNI